MNIVVAGCGRVGSLLAQSLTQDGHDVTVIDRRQAALESLGKSFNGARVQGEAFDVEVMRTAGLDTCDVFVAATDSDNANLMAVEVARRVFHVDRVIGRLYDPHREPAYRALGIRHVTGTNLIATAIFEEISTGDWSLYVADPESGIEMVEFVLGLEARGLTVADLEIRGKLRVAYVSRGSESHIPSRRFELEAGDLVVAAARESAMRSLNRYLAET